MKKMYSLIIKRKKRNSILSSQMKCPNLVLPCLA